MLGGHNLDAGVSQQELASADHFRTKTVEITATFVFKITIEA